MPIPPRGHGGGEDMVIRRAAVEALGPFNGSVVAVDPTPGAFSRW